MLEYAKIILPKVSFSRELFQKELNKCINWVDKNQIQELFEWCYENFNDQYHDIIAKEFSNVAA